MDEETRAAIRELAEAVLDIGIGMTSQQPTTASNSGARAITAANKVLKLLEPVPAS